MCFIPVFGNDGLKVFQFRLHMPQLRDVEIAFQQDRHRFDPLNRVVKEFINRIDDVLSVGVDDQVRLHQLVASHVDLGYPVKGQAIDEFTRIVLVIERIHINVVDVE